MAEETKINLLLFPNVTQLDLTGPYEVLVRMPGAKIELVGPTLDPVKSDRGLTILPTTTRERAPACDLLVVPGGPGADDAILDPQWVAFVREQAKTARWIFGICTGSLLLGAAGLLRGRRSGGHWLARDLLAQFGAYRDLGGRHTLAAHPVAPAVGAFPQEGSLLAGYALCHDRTTTVSGNTGPLTQFTGLAAHPARPVPQKINQS